MLIPDVTRVIVAFWDVKVCPQWRQAKNGLDPSAFVSDRSLLTHEANILVSVKARNEDLIIPV